MEHEDEQVTSLFKQSVRQKIARRRRQPSEFKEATISDFAGGLNTVDNDLQLNSRFAKDLVNFYKQGDGSQQLRYGTNYLWDTSPVVNGNIIENDYFQNHLLTMTEDGEIAKIDSNGTITAIWNTAIANALPGAPAGWSTGLDLIDFTEFKNELVVCNGVDKPILIASDLTVTYLQDIPTGSNVNVPIGKFVTTSSNYTVIAGITGDPDTIYISSSGTSGTWPGDPAPNDAISLNIAAFAPSTGGSIRGLSSFKNLLLIHFATATVVFQLGIYDAAGTTHEPQWIETIQEAGIVSHRTELIIPEAAGFTTPGGFKRMKQNTFITGTATKLMSDKIQTDIQGQIPTVYADRIRSFSFLNTADDSVWLMLYDGSEYNMYIGGTDDTLNKLAWAKATGWNYVCAAVTEGKRVFLCRDTYVFQLGNELYDGEQYLADEVGFYDSVWATSTAYVVGDKVQEGSTAYRCIVAHTSGVFADDLDAEFWEENDGDEIDFVWELPWSDLQSRMRKKHLGFLGLDTSGASNFTLQIFVDDIRLDAGGNLDPALTLDFVGAESGGYGNGPQPYGGGRRTADERRWGFPVQFNKMKLRIVGSGRKGLGFDAITILYKNGTFHR